jgi:hypothetical protein
MDQLQLVDLEPGKAYYDGVLKSFLITYCFFFRPNSNGNTGLPLSNSNMNSNRNNNNNNTQTNNGDDMRSGECHGVMDRNFVMRKHPEFVQKLPFKVLNTLSSLGTRKII